MSIFELLVLATHESLLTSDVFPSCGSYVGRLFVKNTGKPLEILTKLNKMAGYDPEEEIGLYEVCLSCRLIFYQLLNTMKIFRVHFILV